MGDAKVVVLAGGTGGIGEGIVERFGDSIQDNLATHFNFQRVFVDHFHRERGSVYVTLVGPEAKNVLPSIPSRHTRRFRRGAMEKTRNPGGSALKNSVRTWYDWYTGRHR